MNWTDQILGSPSRVAVLRVLAGQGGHAVGVRELARLAHISPIQASRLLRDFAGLGLVDFGSSGKGVAADLGHPVMRDLVLPLIAFEDGELRRAAEAVAGLLAARGIPCQAVLSGTGADGRFLLVVVTSSGVVEEARAALSAEPPRSLLDPRLQVCDAAALRASAHGSLRSQWGLSLARLLEDTAMNGLGPVLQHDFRQGLEGWLLYDQLAQPARWLGRAALMLGGGAPVLAPVNPEPPYTLRATVSGGPTECFVGVCFHVADTDNREMVYLAPHAGQSAEAVQYDPVLNGSNTWQIFGDADGVAAVPTGLALERWHALRVDVWPEIAQVYVDDDAHPAATFVLRAGLTGGRVGLWGYLPAYVADFAVSPLDGRAPAAPRAKAVPPDGAVRDWLIGSWDQASGALRELRAASAEHNGTLCLNRYYRFEPGARALAACEVEAPADAGPLQVEAGYSDRARWWMDGRAIHEGEWRWDSIAGTDGRIRLGQASVAVSAAAGKHLLVAEIASVEPAFGWGVAARVLARGRPCPTGPAPRLDVPTELARP